MPRVLRATLGAKLRGGGGRGSCVRAGAQKAVLLQQVPEANNELHISINLPKLQSKAQQIFSAID